MSQRDIENHEVTKADQFETRKEKQFITIVRYLGTDDIVVVPDNINGVPVNQIEPLAFTTSDVRGVLLPTTITALERTFMDAPKLELVVCKGVKNIGYAAFAHCKQLKNVITSDSLIEIGESAFTECTSLGELQFNGNVIIDESIISTVFSGTSNSFWLNTRNNSPLYQLCSEAGIPTSANAAKGKIVESTQ